MPLLVLLCLAAVPLLLLPQPGRAAPRNEDNAAYNVNVETEGSDPSKYRGDWPGHERYHPSPEDWRKLPVYQLLTDRFADGDPYNNEQWPHWMGFEMRDMSYRHGGDFKGVADKLDYIKGLGCDVIWISPLFQNGYNSYHQYAMTDFTLIDKRLGKLEDLRHLVTEAHKRKMYVIVDIVVNHMANGLYFSGHEKEASDFQKHKGEYLLYPRCTTEKCQAQEPEKRPQPYTDFHYSNKFDSEGKFTFKYKMYDQDGNGYEDKGKGTYSWSDFHHNGDLDDYQDAFNINLGKIYGIMDDLRTESERVQNKLIAMAQALIKSTDVDGFRIDTPMQVDLGFFKAWVPAVRKYAESLGKDNFGFWGEFFVNIGRFATMMGRGKDKNMYGKKDAFIDEVFTLNAGIDYRYWKCLRYALLTPLQDSKQVSLPNRPLWECKEKARYLLDLHEEERRNLDFRNSQKNREENNMWHFCNNHDQWRFQAQVTDPTTASAPDGIGVLKTCLVWLTFWTGIPLHYAGDEQAFATPGMALDGWAREEMTVSLAWQGLRGVPVKDNFDMASPMYLFVQKLNRLRRNWYDKILHCDELWPLDYKVDRSKRDHILAWARGCSHNKEEQILVVERIHLSEEKWNVEVSTPWSPGTQLRDLVNDDTYEVGSSNKITLKLAPYGYVVLVRDASADATPLDPVVVEVSPAHDALHDHSSLYFQFDQKLKNDQVRQILLDSDDVHSEQWCTEDSGCSWLRTKPLAKSLDPGVHFVTLHFKNGGVFRSRFRFSGYGADFAGVDAVIDPMQHTDPDLVGADFKSLTFSAIGATHVRMRNADKLSWDHWQSFESSLKAPKTLEWNSTPGVPVLAQFYAAGSTGYIVGGCRDKAGKPCKTSFYDAMSIRGPDEEWNNPSHMELVEPWTWAGEITVDGIKKVFFAPYADGSVTIGTIMTLPLQRTMMMKSAGRVWPDPQSSLASGAEWAQPLRVDACGMVELSIGDIGYQKETFDPHEWCKWSKSHVRLLFNDRTYEVRMEVVKHLALKWPWWKITLVSLAALLGIGGIAYLVWRCVRARGEKRVVRSGGQPLQEDAGTIELETQGASEQ